MYDGGLNRISNSILSGVSDSAYSALATWSCTTCYNISWYLPSTHGSSLSELSATRLSRCSLSTRHLLLSEKSKDDSFGVFLAIRLRLACPGLRSQSWVISTPFLSVRISLPTMFFGEDLEGLACFSSFWSSIFEKRPPAQSIHPWDHKWVAIGRLRRDLSFNAMMLMGSGEALNHRVYRINMTSMRLILYRRRSSKTISFLTTTDPNIKRVDLVHDTSGDFFREGNND